MKRIRVEVDDSTYRWLVALAKANAVNNKCGMELDSTPGGLLAQAAFCFADYAGRRTGSWEADVGGNLLIASGFQNAVVYEAYDRCTARDDADNRRLMEEWDEIRSYNFLEAEDFGNPWMHSFDQVNRNGWRE